jgi:prevent-host-death family protein
MTRYKKVGSLLQVETSTTAIYEVTMRDLSRDTSGVMARVSEGWRAIVTRRGHPVAAILNTEEAIGLCATVVVSRREAGRRLFGDVLEEQFSRHVARELARGVDRRRS